MSPPFTAAQALAFVREPGEDRLAIFSHEDHLILIMADGAGGISGGARAADMLIELVREAVRARASSRTSPKPGHTSSLSSISPWTPTVMPARPRPSQSRSPSTV